MDSTTIYIGLALIVIAFVFGYLRGIWVTAGRLGKKTADAIKGSKLSDEDKKYLIETIQRAI